MIPVGTQLLKFFRAGIQILHLERGLVTPCDHVGEPRPPAPCQLPQIMDTRIDGVKIAFIIIVIGLA